MFGVLLINIYLQSFITKLHLFYFKWKTKNIYKCL